MSCYDTVTQYRLSEDIIRQFLQEKFGDYNFYVEVSAKACIEYFGIDSDLPALF